MLTVHNNQQSSSQSFIHTHTANIAAEVMIQWSDNMGCAQSSKILSSEDIDFIAKNTALTKAQVEVRK